jgi:predicted MFS family arabinose efflux permease
VGTVIGLPAGQLLGNLIGWRATFGATAGAALLISLAQLALLPALPALAGRMRFAHLGRVVRSSVARTTMLVGAVATIGQFAASTFVTPFLLDDVGVRSGAATVLFFGYGAAGIAGTLVGSALVARSRIWSFAGATAAFGALLALAPALAGYPVIVGAVILVWGLIWGLVPLALQTLMMEATPETPEASAAVLMSVLQLAIAVGSALGGVLVDSAGVETVFVVAGATALVAALLAAASQRGIMGGHGAAATPTRPATCER